MIDTFFKYAYYAFVAAIVAFGLVLLVSALPNATVSVKIVQSGSMEPVIHTGSVVFIHKADVYKVGDIITFFFNERDVIPTTHRIVSIGNADGEVRYQTKGDANKSDDPRKIEQEAVVGKVFFSIPFLGYILDFAKKPLGFVLIIGLPALLIIFDEGMKIYTEVRKKIKEEKEETEESTENND